jgi:hypothetical protein
MVNEADYKGADFTKEQAMQGLKSAIFNNALRKANNTAGLPNGEVLQRELFTQIPGVDPSAKLSMSDFLVRKGMATEDEMAEVQKMIKTIRGIDEAFATNNFENVLFKNPSMAKLFYIRIAGATAGAAAQNQLKKFLGMPQMSGGLIAEQTGSDLVQRVLLRGPETQRIKVMTDMFTNPKLLAEMMKEIQDKKMADNALNTRIAKRLWLRWPVRLAVVYRLVFVLLMKSLQKSMRHQNNLRLHLRPSDNQHCPQLTSKGLSYLPPDFPLRAEVLHLVRSKRLPRLHGQPLQPLRDRLIGLGLQLFFPKIGV